MGERDELTRNLNIIFSAAERRLSCHGQERRETVERERHWWKETARGEIFGKAGKAWERRSRKVEKREERGMIGKEMKEGEMERSAKAEKAHFVTLLVRAACHQCLHLCVKTAQKKEDYRLQVARQSSDPSTRKSNATQTEREDGKQER